MNNFELIILTLFQVTVHCPVSWAIAHNVNQEMSVKSQCQVVKGPTAIDVKDLIVSLNKELERLSRKARQYNLDAHADSLRMAESLVKSKPSLTRYLDKYYAYLCQLPILGYNSGSYDLNLVIFLC